MRSWLKTFPEFTLPLAALTMSTSPLTVTVSCASSTLFRNEYVQEYG